MSADRGIGAVGDDEEHATPKTAEARTAKGHFRVRFSSFYSIA